MKSSSCLAELSLIKIDLDDADPGLAPARAHLAGCAACQARIAEIAGERAEFAATRTAGWATVAPRRGAVRDAPVTRIEDARAQRTRRLGWLGGGAAVAAAAAAVLMWQTSRDGATDRANHDGERIKGAGLHLDVHVRQAGHTAVLADDDTPLHPGDELRFAVATTAAIGSPAHVAVLARDGAGLVSVYATSAGPLDRTAPVALGAVATALPGAVALDDTLGIEDLWLVVCPRPIAVDDVLAQARVQPGRTWPAAPVDCVTTTRQMQKVGR